MKKRTQISIITVAVVGSGDDGLPLILGGN
jgi:hypothetical protein